MREILFRGKLVDSDGKIIKDRDFVHGYYRKQSNGHIIYRKTDVLCGSEVDHETIEQYTGINDANGNKIFEGDIVKNTVSSEIGVVENIRGCWRVECGDIDFNLFDYPIKTIGNITDNPELLEGKE